MWNSQTWLFINSCLPLWPGDLFFSYWTECSSASHPSRKTACVFKNPENAGMIRKLYFQAKSYLFNLHEMFKNSGSDPEFVNKPKRQLERYPSKVNFSYGIHKRTAKIYFHHWGKEDRTRNSALIRGTVQLDFNSFFWHIWVGVGLNKNCLWF